MEFKAYIWWLTAVSAVIVISLLAHHTYYHVGTATLKSVFNVVSLATTTGFTNAPFYSWPTFIPVLMIFAVIIGGCAASTCGGIKIIRLLLLYKQSMREIKRLVHPKGIFTIKFGDQVLPEQVIQAMWGFVSVFIVLFVILLLALLATGLDMDTAFGALASCISNTGASIAKVAHNYTHIAATSKWILIFAELNANTLKTRG